MDREKGSEEIEEELLLLVEEGNEQTWLICVDGKKEVLYDLNDFLDIRKPLRPSYPIIQGEGSSKHSKRGKVRAKLDEQTVKESLKVKNPETKENESSIIKFNISQTEPTLYFQELQKPTPFSSSGSNIKRQTMYDSFIEKCDRSLLEDVEIPKTNLSLISMSFEDSGGSSSEKMSEKKIDSKTFTRPKRTHIKPKVKDPSSRKSFIDELALRYSTEYVNVDAVSPDIESPLDVGERSLDVMSSTVQEDKLANLVELNETFTMNKDNSFSTMIIHNKTFTYNDEQNISAEKEVKLLDGTFCHPPKFETPNQSLEKTGSSSSFRMDDMDITLLDETYDKAKDTVASSIVNRYENPSTAALKMPTIKDEALECSEFQPSLVSTPMKPTGLKKPSSITLSNENSEKSMRKVVSEENLVTQFKKPSYFGSTMNLNNNNKNLGVSTESLPGPSSHIPRPKPSGIPRLASRIPTPSRIPKPSDKK